ncbi:MAG: amidophosphoribosyltransferase [Lachnospiraceae bacterium]|nr:amidophosphoribosyltransferase [Lachnospiraceae bacterium]
MGGFFGIVSEKDCLGDVFFGTDYHSHLGAKRAGIAAYDPEYGLQRKIHSIEDSPFRTKFAEVFHEIKGTTALGCISDFEPQPLLIRTKFGTFAISVIGKITNNEELIEKFFTEINGHFDAKTGGEINTTELVAALINQKGNFVEGIQHVQNLINGAAGILIIKDDGNMIAARDKMGRLPVLIGKREDGFAVSFESFVCDKLGFDPYKELGPGEIVEISPKEVQVLAEAGKEMKICSFLWAYYGYPTSNYEGINVEVMRYRNGKIMARDEAEKGTLPDIDFVGGVPDSGTPHAIGYANESGKAFARAFIKYTPTWSRSFIPGNQISRDEIAKMKMLPVKELIKDKKLLFVDDSIVRGTQLKETVDFLYENGAEEVHMRSACPPIMFNCKYLDFSRGRSEMELIARRVIVELEGEEGLNYMDEYADSKTERGQNLRNAICEKFHFASLEFQSLDGLIEAIGMDPCKLCTYCWNGKE